MRRWIRAAREAATHGVPSAGNLPYSDKGVGADTVTRLVSRTRPRLAGRVGSRSTCPQPLLNAPGACRENRRCRKSQQRHGIRRLSGDFTGSMRTASPPNFRWLRQYRVPKVNWNPILVVATELAHVVRFVHRRTFYAGNSDRAEKGLTSTTL
jgi:hypothetical protein